MADRTGDPLDDPIACRGVIGKRHIIAEWFACARGVAEIDCSAIGVTVLRIMGRATQYAIPVLLTRSTWRTRDATLCKSRTDAIGAATALAVMTPASARATPSTGVSAVTLSKQAVDGKDYIVSDITITPGGSTGWHTHRGQVYGVMKAGTLTHYSADCSQDGVYQAGEPITDPTGPDHVHIARNLGTTPLVLEVTYVDPAGAPTSDSAPNPGCDFN